MPQTSPAEIVRAGSEVRGTQSFVHFMSSVWKRPSLTALEVLWRWLIGVPSLWLLATCARRIWLAATGGTADPARLGLAHITVTEPFAAAQSIAYATSQLLPLALHTARWMAPLLLAAWVIVAAFGRTAVLRRMDPSLRPRRTVFILLGALRIASLTAVFVFWLWMLMWSGGIAVTGPVSRGAEPNLVLYFVLVITLTTLIFIAWALSSWVLGIAPILATLRSLGAWDSIRAAAHLGPMRGKLIEINLVMGIVKVALVVLAMVFSSTPLPFESYTTPGFMRIWWAGVTLLYVLASDYFHVVRTAVSVALWRTYDEP